MSKVIPTPYVWSHNPQTGLASGASQDYSTKMNWLGAGQHMIGRVNNIRDARNSILIKQAAITETPRTLANPPIWPTEALYQPPTRPISASLPRNPFMESFASNNGMQIAGGGLTIGDERFEFPAPNIGQPPSIVRSDGMFQLGGGGEQYLPSPYHALLLSQGSSTVPREGGIGTYQFLSEFHPSVYFHPFSGPPSHYPHQFIYNYDVVDDRIDGYA